MTTSTTRRPFARLTTALICLLVLSACGGTTEPGADTPPAVEEEPSRTVEHALGTTEVPAEPQRIATLSNVIAGHLASTGLLVAAAPESIPESLAHYQEAIEADLDLESIAPIGTESEPNLEALAQVNPEMIIIEEGSAEFYPELSQIAPTVVIGGLSNAEWQQSFTETVEAAGRTDEAADVIESYQQTLAEVPANAAEVEVSCIRINGDGSFRIDGVGGFCGSVAAEAGYAVTAGPADVPPSDSGYIELSGERLDAVTGDLIIAPDARGGTNTLEGFQRNPLWETLPAVQNGEVVTVPNAVYNGTTYVAAELLLKALTESAAATSGNP